MRLRLFTLLVLLALAVPAFAGPRTPDSRLDSVLRKRARQLTGSSRVIVEFRGAPDVRAITGRGGVAGKPLTRIRAHVAEIANSRLASLAEDPRVARISIDRPAFATLERTGATIAATAARDELGLTGAGIGIALIDSGVSGWHDDLYMERDGDTFIYTPRVVHFKDFVSPYPNDGSYTEYPFDDYGHGTHVAGILAGSGFASHDARIGVAPRAHLVGLKVLQWNGAGYVSDVIAGLDYAVSVKDAYNIRVINLSVGAGVYESYDTDPLAQAARRAVDAGIVVVAASGNFGRGENGASQYGGVTSPGNAPWVLTVGASNHQGTVTRSDDGIAVFSSRGPSWIDFSAKPDIVAPGVGIESLAEPWTTLYTTYSEYLLPGTDPWFWYSPYLSLSGTSMAAPVVSGTIALMLEANPHLTPNAVKAILQYTAQVREGEDFLTQGSGLLNARGAVRLARFWANPEGGLGEMADPIGGQSAEWGRHLIWGNYRLSGGVPLPGTNAWAVGLTWGATSSLSGGRVVWGAESLDNIVWTMLDDNIVWGFDDGDNIVWSMDENIVWSMDDNIVWSMDDNIVWSMADDNIVWSMHAADNIVWSMDCGGANCGSVVWGQSAADGTLWGAVDEGDNIVWSMDDNIVWSMLDNNIVWSMSTIEPTLWQTQPAARGRGRGVRGR
ncbi:MAG: S8 family peptidase [Vicinamibacterales bacterium]